MVLPACYHASPSCAHCCKMESRPRRHNRRRRSQQPRRDARISRGMTSRSFITTAALRELALGETLVVDRIRHAFGWALAVPVLWVSTLVYPVMGLAYVLALGAIDTVGHVARRWRAHRG